MNIISIVGLLSFFFITWLMSYHRTKVKIKPVIFGTMLQVLLALIILRTDALSFASMVVLGGAAIVFLLREHKVLAQGSEVVNHAIHVGLALGLGGLLYGAAQAGLQLMYVPLGLLAFIVLNEFVLKRPQLQDFAWAATVSSGIAYFIAEQIHGRAIFDAFSEKVSGLLEMAKYGSSFLFGFNWYSQSNEFFPGFGATFAFGVLPTIIFFGGFMSVLYYLGIIQKIITFMSHFMRWAMGTSGAESLSCSANIFVGQTEAPLLVKPYLAEMTRSEILTVMLGGFATIAGGVLAGYIAMGIDAGHLIAASVMNAPAALVISKIIYPELEHSKTAGDVELPDINVGSNVLEAATNGVTDGLHLALNVGAMLIGFIALIACVDLGLGFLDGLIDGRMLGGAEYEYIAKGSSPIVKEFSGIFPGSLQTLFGTMMKPIAWLMGVPWADCGLIGNLLGVKLALNEFVAYGTLGQYVKMDQISERAQIISTYALCGFANFSSIGIQIGGLSALVPERRKDLADVALRAMLGGTIASWITACIAGMII